MALVLALAVIGIWAFVVPADGPPPEFHRVSEGMSKREVVSVLGPPPECFFQNETGFLTPSGETGKEAGVWQWPDAGLTVWFDGDEAVVHKAWMSARKGLLPRLRDWLGW